MKLKHYHQTPDHINLTFLEETCEINVSIPFDKDWFKTYHNIPAPEIHVSSFKQDVEDVEKSLRKEIKTLKWFVAEDNDRILFMKTLNAIAIILNLPVSVNEIKIPNKKLALVHYWEGVITEDTAKQLIAAVSKANFDIVDIKENTEDDLKPVEETEDEEVISMGEIKDEFEDEEGAFKMGVIEDGN